MPTNPMARALVLGLLAGAAFFVAYPLLIKGGVVKP